MTVGMSFNEATAALEGLRTISENGIELLGNSSERISKDEDFTVVFRGGSGRRASDEAKGGWHDDRGRES